MPLPETLSSPRSGPVTSVKIRLPNGHRTSETDIWNTTLGGVFIQMREPLSFGTELALEFVFAREQPNLQCSGYVVWSTRDAPERAPEHVGIAVRLVDIPISEMRRLAQGVGQALE